MIVDIGSQIAKVTKDHGDTCTVKFLEKRTNSTFRFSTEKSTVSKSDITGHRSRTRGYGKPSTRRVASRHMGAVILLARTISPCVMEKAWSYVCNR